MTLRVVSLVVAALVTTLAACGERPQTATGPQKKLDSAVSDGANNAYLAPGWKTGDATSWEQQMRKRAQGQDEYSRIAGGS